MIQVIKNLGLCAVVQKNKVEILRINGCRVTFYPVNNLIVSSVA